jgi:hypothetical protein
MLHQDSNSELALDDAERQVLGFWTTIFGLWTTIVTTCLGPLATAGITTACPRGTLYRSGSSQLPPDELLRDLRAYNYSVRALRLDGYAAHGYCTAESSAPDLRSPTPDTPLGLQKRKSAGRSRHDTPGVNRLRRSATALDTASPDRYRHP